ncbi:hypothetical protein [Methanococcus voltae]|uniref:Uncharacterized protein n=1 Tax=Methanococcus voltae (strain ATCC BAA-1334 / A3) TaxID=456320 RepID=D7DUI8_METV3|nr:hypothetical protein [Methanococcus voltae]MCS3900598.1 hypothetical protein [Methanococcus voltae]
MINSIENGFKNFKNDMLRPFRGNGTVKLVAYVVGILTISSIAV